MKVNSYWKEEKTEKKDFRYIWKELKNISNILNKYKMKNKKINASNLF